MEPVICEYTEDRIDDVLGFEERLRQEEPGNFFWETGGEYQQRLKDSFHDRRFENALSLLAYLDGKVVGRVDAVLIPTRFEGVVNAYLDWICVLKSCRHRQVAQSLMKELRRRLKEAGAKTLVGLIAANEEARRFYRSLENALIRDEGIWIDL